MYARSVNTAARQGVRVRRILRELHRIRSNPDRDTKIWVVNDDIGHLKGCVNGPPDTPYAGGIFQVDIALPDEYPAMPPIMKFNTKIWHPNVSSQTGICCADVLADHWSPALGIEVLLRMLTIFLQFPNPKDPQDHEVARMMNEEPEQFYLKAREWTIRYAEAPRPGGTYKKAPASAKSARERHLCGECAKLNWSFHLGHFKKSGRGKDKMASNNELGKMSESEQLVITNLGTVGEVFGSRDVCGLCGLVAQALESQIAEVQASLSDKLIRASVQAPNFFPGDTSVLRIFDDGTHDSRFDMTFSFLGDNPLVFERPIVKPQRFDVELLNSWLRNCRDFHTTCAPSVRCENICVGGAKVRFRVIDVLSDCVVEAPRDCKYVALTYVWGPDQQSRLKKTDFRGELDVKLERHELASTISDAMSLVEKLGLRYLWVDSQCIIQDDNEERNVMVHAMDRVYKAAELTIVAASGRSADAGIPGLTKGSRSVESVVGCVEGIDLILNRRRPNQMEPDFNPTEHVWGDRAWTLQEWLFSSRAMIITDQGLFWDCRQAAWTEEQPHQIRESCSPSSRDHFNRRDSKSALGLYYDLVADYTRRKLSKENDILNACTAIFEDFKQFRIDFCWGLPTSQFAAALLWRQSRKAHTPDSPLTRRQCELKKGIKAPSWSWAGWIGEVEYFMVGSEAADLQCEIHWPGYSPWRP